MWQEISRTPFDLRRHLVNGTGEAEHEIGHPSSDVSLNLLQTLLRGAQGAVALNQMLKWLLVAT
jgi:hypothetical protein